MRQPFDLDLLKSFVAVIEAGNLSAAAPVLGRSQSAVSMQMQRLEQMVGKALLMRSPRRVTLTADGERLLAYARRLLRLSDEAFASVATPGEAGTVRLGVPDDYAAFLLPPVLTRFAADHPLVAIELVCEPSVRLNRLIEMGQIDLAIVTRTPEQAFAVLRDEPCVWVASQRQATWDKDPLPIALFEDGCAAHLNVVEALEAANRPFRRAYSSSSLFGLLAAVQAGLAIAGLARCSVPPSLEIIGEHEGLPPLRSLEICMLQNTASTSGATRRLASFLRAELGDSR